MPYNVKRKHLYTISMILVLINSLGFPSNYVFVFGTILRYVIDYGCLALEIFMILFSSGKDLFEVKMLDVKKRYVWIYLLIIEFTLVSMLITRYPDKQLFAALRFSVFVLFSLWVCDTFSILEIVQNICISFGLFALLSIVFVFLRPDLAFTNETGHHALCGIFTVKNTMGDIMCMGIIMFYVLYVLYKENHKKLPRFYLPVLCMQFGLLSLTQATNACITLLFVFIFLLFIGPFESQRRLHLGMYYILISISFLLFALTILPHFAWLLNAIGKDVTISGRTPLWERVIDVMLHHNSFTGFGLLMFWRDPKATILLQREFARNTYFATHTVGAHNLLLELWLTVGIFGIGIYFICLLSSFKKINQLKPDQYLLCAAIINCVMFYGLTDRGFALANDYKVFFLFLAMAIANTREVKPEWLFKQEEDPKTDVISYQKSES